MWQIRQMRRLLLALVFIALPTGCKSKAEKQHAKAQKQSSELADKGEECFQRGRYDCALEAFREALKRRKDDAELLNRFAMAARLRYYQSGDEDFRDQELEALKKAVKLAPRLAHVQVNFGTTCWEMSLRREAARAYQQALELAPKHPDAAIMRDRIKRSTTEVEDEEQE